MDNFDVKKIKDVSTMQSQHEKTKNVMCDNKKESESDESEVI